MREKERRREREKERKREREKERRREGEKERRREVRRGMGEGREKKNQKIKKK